MSTALGTLTHRSQSAFAAVLVALVGTLGIVTNTRAQDCNSDGLADAQQVGVQGLTAQYFANRTWTGTPAAVRVDLGGAGGFDLSNWSLPAGVPSDEFSVRWTGGLVFNQTAAFQFRVSSDDAYRLYLDGVLIGSSNNVTSGQVVPATPITVTAGVHHIRVELREDFGEAKMKLERKTSSATTWSVIANTNFRAGVDNNSNGVLDLCDSDDCNQNFLPDAFDIAANAALDCNTNGVLDVCESTAVDCDQNGLPDSCEPTLVGLAGRYYATNDFSGPIVAKRLDASGPLGLDFNVTNGDNNEWMPDGVPTDNFSVRWTGSLIVPESGNYDFQMQSDDFARLWIDGVLLFGSNVGNEERGPFYLEAGTRLIQLDLREIGGDQRMRLRWRPSGTPDWLPIAGTRYRPSYDGDGDGVSDVCETGDCNANGVPDGFELAQGLATDCNTNGVLDACDVAAGATDCNANGVLDACEATASGLVGRYYPRLGSSNPKDPYRPGPLVAVRRDANIAFANSNWQPEAAPRDDLIVIWTGSIKTTNESGVWRFRSDSDDGMRVYINGQVVINRWLENSGIGFGAITLDANTAYDIRVEFHEGIGGQFCFLEWAPPSAGSDPAYAIVPTSAFRLAIPDCNDNNIPDDCDIANGTLPDPGAGIPTPCSGPACPADLDGNGAVEAADLSLLLAAWGSVGGDVDGNGSTDAADLSLLLAAWGNCG
jgi:hypothetical protein